MSIIIIPPEDVVPGQVILDVATTKTGVVEAELELIRAATVNIHTTSVVYPGGNGSLHLYLTQDGGAQREIATDLSPRETLETEAVVTFDARKRYKIRSEQKNTNADAGTATLKVKIVLR